MLSVFVLVLSFFNTEAARILAVFPTPSISHQVVFRPLTTELAKRGHEVVVITTDPAFPKGKTLVNLTEIDVHELSYTIWRDNVLKSTVTRGTQNDLSSQLALMYNLLTNIFEKQMETMEVQKILHDTNQKFDLLLLEAVARPTLGLYHIYKAPVIQISSCVPIYNNLETVGAATHPMIYPVALRQKINNLTNWDKLKELQTQYMLEKIITESEVTQNEAIRRVFGPNTPPLSELYQKIDMLFINTHPLWDSNRAVPPNVIYLGGLHRKPQKNLPKDLKSYLDSSKHGVIYISFGTNVSPSALPPEKIQLLVRVFASLSYDVLWKWDQDVLPGQSPNIKISKWFPQSDLLRHPKLKLFITQGGLQSTDEAITAGVPMIGMPMLGDQWYNVEQYVRHKIGLRLDMELLTDDKFRGAIETIMKDDSYRKNILRLRSIMSDQPQSPLERAVWWTEYVLRHGGARHLRSPAANMSWAEYLELELIMYILISIACIVFSLLALIYYLVMAFNKNYTIKIKQN